jgi:hypothetical protein
VRYLVFFKEANFIQSQKFFEARSSNFLWLRVGIEMRGEMSLKRHRHQDDFLFELFNSIYFLSCFCFSFLVHQKSSSCRNNSGPKVYFSRSSIQHVFVQTIDGVCLWTIYSLQSKDK